MVFYIRNIKKKMDVHSAAKWFGRDVTIIHGERRSERGVVEDIYILNAGQCFNLAKNEVHKYVSDTGLGHGGAGSVKIKNHIYISDGKIMAMASPLDTNEIKKLPIWICV